MLARQLSFGSYPPANATDDDQDLKDTWFPKARDCTCCKVLRVVRGSKYCVHEMVVFFLVVVGVVGGMMLLLPLLSPMRILLSLCQSSVSYGGCLQHCCACAWSGGGFPSVAASAASASIWAPLILASAILPDVFDSPTPLERVLEEAQFPPRHEPPLSLVSIRFLSHSTSLRLPCGRSARC